MIKVLLADDHIMVRDGLRYLLEAAGDMQIVAIAATGKDAVTKAVVYHPDVAIVDVSMPDTDGIEATRQIMEYCPHTRVLMLSMYPASEYIEMALKAGAAGYVLKDEAGYELVMAVRALARGSRYFSRKIARIAGEYL